MFEFSRGHRLEKKRGRVDGALLRDMRNRQGYIADPHPVPYHSRGFFGLFPVRSSVYVVVKGVGDTFPLNKSAPRKADSELQGLVNFLIFQDEQKYQEGDREPAHAKFMGAGFLVMSIVIAAMIGYLAWSGAL
jgi:hypothetical protein